MLCYCHCVKNVRIRSYSGPYFPAFGLNTKKYSVSLRIQSEYRQFLRSVREWHRRGKFLKKKTNRITFLLRLIFQQNGQFFSNMIVTLKAKTCEEMAYI